MSDTNVGKGFIGQILEVNLSSRKTNIRELDIKEVTPYIGGKGYGAKLLWDLTEAQFDPLGPENPLIFATGPLTGTDFPSSGRMCIITKSPLTGTYNDSHVGGHFGPEMKFAGYDFLIIRGKSDEPVYLWIKNDKVEIRDASDLWGKDVFQTEEKIKEQLNDRSIRISSIGPAGENLVQYASVCIDLYRHAARGGIGTVMGSKKLKAIAIRGTGYIDINNREEFDKLAIDSVNAIEDDPDLQTKRRWGTARSVNWASDQSIFPTRNFQSATFEEAHNLSGESMERNIWVKTKACYGCTIHCAHLAVVPSSPYKGSVVGGVEYELTSLLGANCGVENLNALVHANMLCDKLGLDAISTGSSIAWAMECFEKGIFDKSDTGGLDLRFGNHKAMNKMIKKIAYRDGLGNLLADGVKRASQKVEKGKEFAMQVKGLELPAWGERAAPSMGLAYATADRGGCHQRAFPIGYDLGAETPDGKVLDRFTIEGKARVTKYEQDKKAALYSLIVCDFAVGTLGMKRLIELLNAATGWDYDKGKFLRAGERIWNLSRAFNIREGLTKDDDNLPERLFKDALPEGIAKGKKLSKKDFQKMLDEYYEERKWDPNTGIPTKQTLQELSLKFIAKEI